ncbi:dicarboxylate/amino acid:cation symporter [Jeotgalibacillus sp. S-D1]|uniref:dicarboxylate/amino acid:cation symporter n=1 Tax=Jeotgalibacillus sp. S-D1 TaxID=2552189 RepID=UPI00105A8952|nr:dicarboxylate/amino acid:cation symporter [Jeotgalibacillus sp. S-D1]TDL30486.1 dicarboxylate/amino acid:cation symporter [Jeotgalibacillus sp. S-D1]
MKKIGLLPRIILAIGLGIALGSFAPDPVIRVFATFNGIFGNFLDFAIPLIIIAFIAPGIGAMGRGAGKILGITTGIAYTSTVLAGLLAFASATLLYPVLMESQASQAFDDPENALLSGFFEIEMAPLMGIMTALLLAFVLGVGISSLKSDFLLKSLEEFRVIIQKLIEKIIIPLLPIHIFGIFANMTQGGQVSSILSVFLKVFIMIIALHLIYLSLQYTVAGGLHKKSPFTMMKQMAPAYFTALGTQSSASTIPVTLERTKKVGVRGRIADFCVPLLATIHLSGSTITLVSCAMAVMLINGQNATFGQIFPFILMLGITMIAAPGVPGGAVMASLGLLDSMLGFTGAMTSLMLALYLAQDSFGTACNVTGDGAISAVVDKFSSTHPEDLTESKIG